MSGYDLPMLSTVADVATLVSTRAAFHTLAERVLAPDLQRATGRIGLRRTAGGFGQPEHVVDGVRRRIRVDGMFLVVDHDGDGESWHDITTLEAAAALVGLPPDADTGVFVATSAGHPDAPLAVDRAAAATIAEWFRFVDTALEEFRHRHAALHPSVVQLWPEHFDLACSIGEINFGGSPGDAGDSGRVEPYLYVGPWSPPPVGGFWNEPYGAALERSAVTTVDDALEFFERGLAAAS
ncbi:MAG: hypothetical protein V9G12_12920 [Microthrixaceae bacterium]|jgi:hypothetical protein